MNDPMKAAKLALGNAIKEQLKEDYNEDYIEKNFQLAKNSFQAALNNDRSDIVAEIYCALIEAFECRNTQAEHEEGGKKLSAALEKFADKLNSSSLEDSEKIAVIRDITSDTIGIAKFYNRLGCMVHTLGLQLALIAMSIGDDKMYYEELASCSNECTNNALLSAGPAIAWARVSGLIANPEFRAASIESYEASLEIFVEAPSFFTDGTYYTSLDVLKATLDGLNLCDPDGFHYIPEPKLKYLDYDSTREIRDLMLKEYRKSKMHGYVQSHNSSVRRKEQDFKEKLRLEKISRYWEEHPDEKGEINGKIDSNKARIADIDAELDQLEEKIAGVKHKYFFAPIPEKEEKEQLEAKIYSLESRLASLGLFSFKEKKLTKEEIAEAKERCSYLSKVVFQKTNDNEKAAEEENRPNVRRMNDLKRERNDLENNNSYLRKRLSDPISFR